jgi:hypothetical protein
MFGTKLDAWCESSDHAETLPSGAVMWLVPAVLAACVATEVLSPLAASVAAAAPPSTQCRCTPPDPCWASVPWVELNESVGGRLLVSVDELAACVTDIKSDACAAALAMTDDEFWLADRCVATNSLISSCCDATSCCTRLMHQHALRCARAHMHTHTHTRARGDSHAHTHARTHTAATGLSHVDPRETSRANGYQHTGLYGTWNISHDLSAFAVAAQTESDFTSTVAFAAKHNLRLVVKATGHGARCNIPDRLPLL